MTRKGIKEVQVSAHQSRLSLGRTFHVPLFVTLPITGGMHVAAVHTY